MLAILQIWFTCLRMRQTLSLSNFVFCKPILNDRITERTTPGHGIYNPPVKVCIPPASPRIDQLIKPLMSLLTLSPQNYL